MTYRVLFKGDIEPIHLDDDKGLRLMTKWKNNELTGKVQIGDSVYEGSTIKAITVNKDFERKQSSHKDMDWLENELKGTDFDDWAVKEGFRGRYENGILYVIDPEKDTALGKINADLGIRQWSRWRAGKSDEEIAEHWKQIREKYPLNKRDLVAKLSV